MKVQCNRCLNGQGTISAFKHVMNGVCFKCGGTGFVEQKTSPRPSNTYEFSFLWEDENDPNFMGGEYCMCFTRKARSLTAAEKIAEKKMRRNGSQGYRVRQVQSG